MAVQGRGDPRNISKALCISQVVNPLKLGIPGAIVLGKTDVRMLLGHLLTLDAIPNIDLFQLITTLGKTHGFKHLGVL